MSPSLSNSISETPFYEIHLPGLHPRADQHHPGPPTDPGWAPRLQNSTICPVHDCSHLPCFQRIHGSHVSGASPASYPGSAALLASLALPAPPPLRLSLPLPPTAGSGNNVCVVPLRLFQALSINLGLFLSLGYRPHPPPPQLPLSSEDAAQVSSSKEPSLSTMAPCRAACVSITALSAEFITVQSRVCLFHQGMEYKYLPFLRCLSGILPFLSFFLFLLHFSFTSLFLVKIHIT